MVVQDTALLVCVPAVHVNAFDWLPSVEVTVAMFSLLSRFLGSRFFRFVVEHQMLGNRCKRDLVRV